MAAARHLDRADAPTGPGAPAAASPAISATAQDYLKAVWSATEWGGPAVTTKALAERFGTTPATVSDTVKRLAGHGLLEHQPYKAITLTPLGEQHALQMVRRHRLLETFLVTTLGYGSDEVHDEAEALEHWVSDLMVERIDALLGHPLSDPHGDPIPSVEGRVHRPDDPVSLASAAAGRYVVARVSDADPDRLTWFLEHGIAPGAVVEVAGWDERSQTIRLAPVSQGPGGSEPLTLAAVVADAVILTPPGPSPS